ncbi:uncharacterized protein TNCV_1798601 [Trichonephila clavipes]|uniref:Uncharacterized protein n=1 Tax=Trichonephila clavipes TaxID=2585209 RepID=A0A8X6ST13_TRICX|nr:uncharacterized protein TNCV_1798601 [Trichonephila clavipes]
MAQKKHLDDFCVVELLDGRNVDVPSWKYPRYLESPRVSSPGFGNDSKMMVMPVDVTAQVAPELRRMRTGIFGSYCQKKQTEHSIRPVSSALFSYRYNSFKANRVQTLRAHWSICSPVCQMCSTYRKSLSSAINLE